MSAAKLVRSILTIATITVATFTTASITHAAGTVTIEQISTSANLGTWRLQTPSGRLENRTNDPIRSIGASDGNYHLFINPPRGASVQVKVLLEGKLLQTLSETSIPFTFNGVGSMKIEISYSYTGTVRVDSKPRGARFELRGPLNERWTGLTPATLTNMPPVYYTVSGTPPPGCQAAQPQARTLEPDGRVDFNLDFVCVGDVKTVGNTKQNKVPTVQAKTPATARAEEAMSRSNVQIFHTVNQTETVPGSRVMVTLGVRNVSRSTLENVGLTEQFNGDVLSLPFGLPENGQLSGNTASWTIPTLLAGQSWSVQFPVTVKDSVSAGQMLSLNARVGGGDVHAPRGELLSSIVRIGVVTLPATGSSIVLLFALLSLLGAGLLSLSINRLKKPVVQIA